MRQAQVTKLAEPLKTGKAFEGFSLTGQRDSLSGLVDAQRNFARGVV